MVICWKTFLAPFSLLLFQDEDCSEKFSQNYSLNVIMTDIGGHWRSLILLATLFGVVWGQVLNIQRCGDPQCQGKTIERFYWKKIWPSKTYLYFTGVISEGRTVLKYHANSNSMLSFGQSQPVKIFSKGDGNQQDIWGVEVSRKKEKKSFYSKVSMAIKEDLVFAWGQIYLHSNVSF